MSGGLICKQLGIDRAPAGHDLVNKEADKNIFAMMIVTKRSSQNTKLRHIVVQGIVVQGASTTAKLRTYTWSVD